MGTFFSLQGSQPSRLRARGKMVFHVLCVRCTALHEEQKMFPTDQARGRNVGAPSAAVHQGLATFP